MKKERSRSSCLSTILWGGAIFLCVCVPLLAGTLWVGNKINTIAMATPTEITTCAGMLDVTLHGFRLPDGEKIVTDSMQDLVVYQASGDQIADPKILPVAENLKPLQTDTASQQRVWDYFVKIIPPEKRTKITEYKIITDGTGNFNAEVFIEYTWDQSSITEKWSLQVDLADFIDERQFTSSLLHEFGHMLTLNINQIDYRLDSPVARAISGTPDAVSLIRIFNSFLNASGPASTTSGIQSHRRATRPQSKAD